MKRSIFAATLALTPALLHAQAAASAQTGTLQARVSAPAALTAAASKNADAAKIRISTGIVAPQQIQPFSLNKVAGPRLRVASQDVTIVVTMMVDATGKPENVTISQSGGETLDKEVLGAVSQYRFIPGKLDGENYALPLNLSVIIPRGTEY